MRCNCRRGGGNALSGWAQATTNGGIEPRSDPTITLTRLTSPRRRWFGPSSSGSRPSRCTSCNRFGRTCTSCTCIRVRVRVRPSRRAEQPQGAPHASDYALPRTPKRAATPQLVAGGRPKRCPPNLQTTIGPPTYRLLLDLDKRSVPAKAARAARFQVVAGRAAAAEPLRTGVVVTPRRAEGAREHGSAGRAGVAVSRWCYSRAARV